ncbi:hypothetical protein D9M69_545660 [compost metagenome]
MRGLAGDVDLHVGDARGAERHLFVAGAGGLEREHVVGQLGFFLDQVARTEGAFFFVGVEQHGDGAVVAHAVVFQQLERVQDDGVAALVVGDAGAVGLVAFDAERRLGERALGVHGVHVRHEQQVLAAAALEIADDVVADHEAGRLAARDGEAEVLQLAFEVRAGGGHAFGVTGAGLDVDELLERLDHRRLLVGGGLEQHVVALLGPGATCHEGGSEHGGNGGTVNGWAHEISCSPHGFV